MRDEHFSDTQEGAGIHLFCMIRKFPKYVCTIWPKLMALANLANLNTNPAKLHAVPNRAILDQENSMHHVPFLPI